MKIPKLPTNLCHPQNNNTAARTKTKWKYIEYVSSQLFSSSESLANIGQNSPILKWQSILAKWCHAACRVSLCEAVGLFLISWWGQTTFLSHLEGNNGARKCTGSQTKTAPRTTLNQGRQPVFVCFLVFLYLFLITAVCALIFLGLLSLFGLLLVEAICMQQLGRHVYWTQQKQ